jgi:hypothetical protein
LRRAHHFSDLQGFDADDENYNRREQTDRDTQTSTSPSHFGFH